MIKLTVETTDGDQEDFDIQEGVDRYFIKDRILVVCAEQQYHNYPFEHLRCYRAKKEKEKSAA